MDEGLHGGAVVQIGQQVHDVLGTRLVINLHSSAVAAKESDQLRQIPSPALQVRLSLLQVIGQMMTCRNLVLLHAISGCCLTGWQIAGAIVKE